ncbi:MAG: tRNA 2-selenouridine(34) synthase MnmH [Pseudomonadota bacterium]
MGYVEPHPAASTYERAEALIDLAAPPWDGFDTLIDVRSPAEFAEDHIPAAINLPVLSDEERALVGTIYTRESPFKARKIGAALVARNSAAHIERALMDKDGAWQPMVYCWRGGQRSGSFATILGQIGWRTQQLEGGYRSYRRAVVSMLYECDLTYKVLRLDGYTGSAKTELLHLLAARDVQVIDLEGLACHRGSALGDVDGPQPAQKAFESALAAQLLALDPARPVLIEAESARIGELRLPPALWAAMRAAPRLIIDAPVAARARYLAQRYADLAEDCAALAERLDKLRAFVGHDAVDGWLAQARAGAIEAVAEGLVRRHYDPAYARLRTADTGAVLARFETGSLDAPALSDLAGQIAAWIRAA